LTNTVYNMDLIANACEQFLRSTEPMEGADGRPHDWKTIVCLSPAIALVVPPDLDKVSKGDLLGTNHAVRTFGPTSGGYDCGTLLLYNTGMLWFSPDLKQRPELVSFGADGSAEIKFLGGTLKLQIRGDICTTQRD